MHLAVATAVGGQQALEELDGGRDDYGGRGNNDRYGNDGGNYGGGGDNYGGSSGGGGGGGGSYGHQSDHGRPEGQRFYERLSFTADRAIDDLPREEVGRQRALQEGRWTWYALRGVSVNDESSEIGSYTVLRREELESVGRINVEKVGILVGSTNNHETGTSGEYSEVLKSL